MDTLANIRDQEAKLQAELLVIQNKLNDLKKLEKQKLKDLPKEQQKQEKKQTRETKLENARISREYKDFVKTIAIPPKLKKTTKKSDLESADFKTFFLNKLEQTGKRASQKYKNEVLEEFRKDREQRAKQSVQKIRRQQQQEHKAFKKRATDFHSQQQQLKTQTQINIKNKKGMDVIEINLPTNYGFNLTADLTHKIKEAAQPIINGVFDNQRAVKVVYKIVADIEFAASGDIEERTFAHTDRYQSRDINYDSVLTAWIEQTQQDGGRSGGSLKNLKKIWIEIYHIIAKVGGSYVELPAAINNKKCCINVKNEDNCCSMYAVMAFERVYLDGKAKNPQDIKNYVYTSGLPKPSCYNFSMVNYPTGLKDVKAFEAANPVSISVFEWDSGKPNVLYNSARQSPDRDHIDLLLHNNHFVWIKNFKTFVGLPDRHTLICRNCLSSTFKSQENLDAHFRLCVNNETCKVKMPEKGSTIQFKQVHATVKQPFVLYSDFESILEKVNDGSSNIQKHLAASYFILLDVDPEVNYTGRREFVYPTPPQGVLTADEWQKIVLASFSKHLEAIATDINKFIGFKRSRYQDPNSMIITSDQQQAHDLATTCHYCEGPFTEKNPKVRDHCHLTNKYRAAACNNCNKLIREGSGTIPLYFHNARGYDNHHVYTMLSQRDSIDNDCVNIIENTSERTMCIELNQKRTYTDKTGETKTAKDNWSISVRDSVQILGSTSSLATHINSLPIEKRTCMKQCIETYLKRPADDDTLELLLRKQVFPYSWFDAPSKLQHRSINNDPEAQVFSDDPSIWYDCLTGAAADSSDIEHVKKVWEIMGFESFKDYHDFYLKLDVCGLADVMRAFRDELMSTHKLDPCHFISLSSFTWAAMLRSTKVKLEHLTDHEMYLFFESQKRGGFTCAIERHAQGTDNTPDVTNKMIYVDANNLYGHSMMRNLPHSGFRWLPNLTVDNVLHLTSCYNPESSTGYVFEVDIEYPEHLHELHDDLPLLPYNRSIAHDELSDYQQQALGDVPLCAVPKLIADFKKREKYIINIEQLQFAIKHGLVVTAVHRGITFQQSAWLKPYIELNSALRQQATSDFGKGLYKLLNNAIFGKTMENVRGRTDAIITSASDEQNLIREQSKFRFKRRQDINNMSIITHGKCSVKLDKPVYVGSQILDYSKILMASFFHDKLVPTYGRDNTRLVYTDTDSFILQIKTGDIWKELAENHKHLAEGFDFSNFPKDHNLYSKDKAKVPGYFKCETAEKLLKEVVCLRAKSYAYTTHDGYSDCKAKGVPMRCAKEFTIDTYRRVLDTREDQEVQFKTIQSRGHQLYTMAQSKRAFSAFDDKRWIEADGVRTRAYR